jgi:hypothetical protein
MTGIVTCLEARGVLPCGKLMSSLSDGLLLLLHDLVTVGCTGDCTSATAKAGVICGPSGASGKREGIISEMDAMEARRMFEVEDELVETAEERRLRAKRESDAANWSLWASTIMDVIAAGCAKGVWRA